MRCLLCREVRIVQVGEGEGEEELSAFTEARSCSRRSGYRRGCAVCSGECIFFGYRILVAFPLNSFVYLTCVVWRALKSLNRLLYLDSVCACLFEPYHTQQNLAITHAIVSWRNCEREGGGKEGETWSV